MANGASGRGSRRASSLELLRVVVDVEALDRGRDGFALEVRGRVLTTLVAQALARVVGPAPLAKVDHLPAELVGAVALHQAMVQHGCQGNRPVLTARVDAADAQWLGGGSRRPCP